MQRTPNRPSQGMVVARRAITAAVTIVRRRAMRVLRLAATAAALAAGIRAGTFAWRARTRALQSIVAAVAQVDGIRAVTIA